MDRLTSGLELLGLLLIAAAAGVYAWSLWGVAAGLLAGGVCVLGCSVLVQVPDMRAARRAREAFRKAAP